MLTVNHLTPPAFLFYDHGYSGGTPRSLSVNTISLSLSLKAVTVADYISRADSESRQNATVMDTKKNKKEVVST